MLVILFVWLFKECKEYVVLQYLLNIIMFLTIYSAKYLKNQIDFNETLINYSLYVYIEPLEDVYHSISLLAIKIIKALFQVILQIF